MSMNMTELGKRARAASRIMAKAPTDKKNQALSELAAILGKDRQPILDANAKDVAAAKTAGLAEGLIDRLTLTPARLDGIAADLRKVIDLPDPVGERYDESTRPSGLHLWRQRVPLGVLGVIYESRPNVTVDVAGLAVKTGNAAILRGGSETIHSNRALVAAVHARAARRRPARGCRPLRRRPGPRAGDRTARARRLRGHDHPARRGRPAPLLPRAQPHPGDHRRDGHLPPVCRTKAPTWRARSR